MKLEEAEHVSREKDEARGDLDSILENVKSLYAVICPNDTDYLQERPLNDSNVMDYLQSMENRILDYLICVEYIRMKVKILFNLNEKATDLTYSQSKVNDREYATLVI